ncbi:MAG: phasin family protein [Paracoccaceae bacterium]
MNTEMTNEVTAQYKEFTAEAQKNIEQGVEKMTASIEDFSTFGQQNMEALVTSSKRAAKAAEEINAQLAAFTKRSLEDGMAAAKDMTTSKSVTELMEKQMAFAKNSFDGFFAEMGKLQEIAASATKETMDPLTERLNATTELFKFERA